MVLLGMQHLARGAQHVDGVRAALQRVGAHEAVVVADHELVAAVEICHTAHASDGGAGISAGTAWSEVPMSAMRMALQLRGISNEHAGVRNGTVSLGAAMMWQKPSAFTATSTFCASRRQPGRRAPTWPIRTCPMLNTSPTARHPIYTASERVSSAGECSAARASDARCRGRGSTGTAAPAAA